MLLFSRGLGHSPLFSHPHSSQTWTQGDCLIGVVEDDFGDDDGGDTGVGKDDCGEDDDGGVGDESEVISPLTASFPSLEKIWREKL